MLNSRYPRTTDVNTSPDMLLGHDVLNEEKVGIPVFLCLGTERVASLFLLLVVGCCFYVQDSISVLRDEWVMRSEGACPCTGMQPPTPLQQEQSMECGDPLPSVISVMKVH
jgi:hypothetical protein